MMLMSWRHSDVGHIEGDRSKEFAATLRYLKVTRKEDIPLSLEIAVLTQDASSLAPAVGAPPYDMGHCN